MMSVVCWSHLACLHQQPHPGALLQAHQVVVDGTGGKQRRHGDASRTKGAVRQHHIAVAWVDNKHHSTQQQQQAAGQSSATATEACAVNSRISWRRLADSQHYHTMQTVAAGTWGQPGGAARCNQQENPSAVLLLL